MHNDDNCENFAGSPHPLCTHAPNADDEDDYDDDGDHAGYVHILIHKQIPVSTIVRRQGRSRRATISRYLFPYL